ncbi:MAG: ArnT family glycosyltransferase [Saprospiraceae bacterium]
MLILLLNLLQSGLSELAHDEAYYWVYSQSVEWGYFDHPPAIAWLVGLGYMLLENELGVRLFVVLANLLTIYLMYRITNPKEIKLFFLLLLSCVITHVGFLAVPDIPLLFSVALFFFFYKKYLVSYDFKNALILGIVIALMGYSKYHGIVVLVSVLLSNLSLLRRKTFYLAVLAGAVLYTPHLYWQYINDFPTFRFHLFDRSAEAYSFAFLGEYILGQLLIFGPLVGFLLFWTLYRFKEENQFERSLKFTCYGIFSFFLLSSLKGRVEPNWTAMAMVPLIYIGYHYIVGKDNLVSWTYRLAIPSLVLILSFRCILIVEILPKRIFPLASEFHGGQKWAKELDELTEHKPALFINSYQRASKYSFYGKNKGFAINNVGYAGSQFDLLIDDQEQLQGEKVAVVHLVGREQKGTLIGGKDNVVVDLQDEFYFYNRLKINVINPPDLLEVEESTSMKIEICNPTDQTVILHGNDRKDLSVGYISFDVKKWIGRSKKRSPIPVKEIHSGDCIPMTITYTAPDSPGAYRYRMSINNGYYDERNDNFHQLKVIE